MYAVIKTGGKQYKVTVGEKLKVEQIPAELDSQIELEVLMIADGDKLKLGEEAAKAKVVAKVVAHGRGEKSAFSKCAAANTIKNVKAIAKISPKLKFCPSPKPI